MLHLVDVLSSDEDSPSGPNGPPGEHVTGMMAAAAAVANTTLAGCDNGPAGDASGFTVSVPTLVLITWTLLCMLYSWWMLRASPWHDMNYVEKPPVTVLIPAELCTTEEVEPVVEGLVTVTLKRVPWTSEESTRKFKPWKNPQVHAREEMAMYHAGHIFLAPTLRGTG